MINCEGKLLKSTVKKIKKYKAEHVDALSFFNEIENLKDVSLQSLSLKNDLKFYDEIDNVLAVVVAIIRNPHIVNTREDMIVRAEQAHSVTPTMFMDTVLDTKLWRDKNGIMTPQEVHYFNNIDDLKNYENRFVTLFVDKLEQKLADYAALYALLVDTVGDNGFLTTNDSELRKAYEKMNVINHKIKRIKDTYFYKEVSKTPITIVHVTPTNVIKHNRLYRVLYKFWTSSLDMGGERVGDEGLVAFYYVKLLTWLKGEGFSLVEKSKGASMNFVGSRDIRRYKPIIFENEEFNLTLRSAKDFGGLYVFVKNKSIKSRQVNPCVHLILFDGSVGFENIDRDLELYKDEKSLTVTALSVWNCATVEEKLKIARGSQKEDALVETLMKGFTTVLRASKVIYKDHCPVCGGKDVREDGVICRCGSCLSEYAFGSDKLWITKLSRN